MWFTGAMKEDVLEQIVDDYLKSMEYFTRHNIKFRPSPEHPDYVKNLDSVPSDIDVLGYNPRKDSPSERVVAVSCKSWQGGFNAERILHNLVHDDEPPSKQHWKDYREVWVPKWSEAYVAKVHQATGQREFTFLFAVTRMHGAWDEEIAAQRWAEYPRIAQALDGRPLKFLTLETMWNSLSKSATRTPESSEIGRVLQLLRAAKLIDPKGT
jgi:hypothetical protein